MAYIEELRLNQPYMLGDRKNPFRLTYVSFPGPADPEDAEPRYNLEYMIEGEWIRLNEWPCSDDPEDDFFMLEQDISNDWAYNTAGSEIESDWPPGVINPVTIEEIRQKQMDEQYEGVRRRADDIDFERRAREEAQKMQYPFLARLEAGRKMETWPDIVTRVIENPRKFVVDSFIVERQLSALGAEQKAGKTWFVVDLAVSICTGTKFLDTFEARQGKVAIYANEGGEYDFYRYVEAVCRWKGVSVEDLNRTLRVQFVAPRVDNPTHVNQMYRDLSDFGPDLTIIDPWFRSAGSADGSNLAEMGAVINNLQAMTEQVGSALLLTTHWNKTGANKGVSRWTGAGLQESARLLINMETKDFALDDHKTTQDLHLETSGSNTQAFNLRRTVEAVNHEDVMSSLRYEISLSPGVYGDNNGKKTQKINLVDSVMNIVKEGMDQDPPVFHTCDGVFQVIGGYKKAVLDTIRTLTLEGRLTRERVERTRSDGRKYHAVVLKIPETVNSDNNDETEKFDI